MTKRRDWPGGPFRQPKGTILLHVRTEMSCPDIEAPVCDSIYNTLATTAFTQARLSSLMKQSEEIQAFNPACFSGLTQSEPGPRLVYPGIILRVCRCSDDRQRRLILFLLFPTDPGHWFS